MLEIFKKLLEITANVRQQNQDDTLAGRAIYHFQSRCIMVVIALESQFTKREIMAFLEQIESNYYNICKKHDVYQKDSLTYRLHLEKVRKEFREYVKNTTLSEAA